MRRAALLAVFLSLALLHTWPLASAPGSLSRLDNADTGLNTWIVAWVQHILPSDPLRLFDAPIFFPERHTLAFSEHLLVPALMGAPLAWLGLSPVLVYNLLVIAGLTLSGWTMCLVLERWTRSTAAGVVAGSLFAFNAHLLTRFAHLQALHAQFYPLTLLAFDAVLTEREPRRVRRAGLLLTIVFVLQALCSNYAMVFLGVALIVAALVRAPEWIGRGRSVKASTLAVSALASAVLLLPFLWPYYLVRRDAGLTRPIEEVRLYSAGLFDYLTTAAMPGYAWLHAHVPPLQGVRGAARWGFLLLMAVAILAGYAVASLQRRWRLRPYWPAVFAVLLGAVTIEAIRTPMSFVPFGGIPAIYDILRGTPHAVVVEWPLYSGDAVSRNARYMVAGTRHFHPLVNGYSGFEPAAFRERAKAREAFPSDTTLEDMTRAGVTHAVLHVKDLRERVVQEASVSLRLLLVADDGERRLYQLRVD
jgi:hypothetical protein